MTKQAVLKPGKEKPVLNRHHWIFSGAILTLPQFEDGDILQVLSSEGKLLGSAYFNRKAKIIARMVCFDDSDVKVVLSQNLKKAFHLRTSIFTSHTTAYRLVNGEGDFLPGLVIDRYNDVFVIQISTLGMEKFKALIVENLKESFQPTAIYEKSTSSSRKEEGLTENEGLLFGKLNNEVMVLENGLKFLVSPTEGQKTGFFLDHREMRKKIMDLSSGKHVLNTFCYTGGFSIYALAGKAKQVTSVDISDKAIALCKQNVRLNQLDETLHHAYTEDVFKFIRHYPCKENLIILDPPAFAKKQKDVIPACRGYKDLNRIVMQKMEPNSLLLTCSCSYFVNDELFKKVLFQASVEAKKKVQILEKHHLAFDHPLNLCHPEGDYLKSYLLHIS